jgi:hypothetical protein
VGLNPAEAKDFFRVIKIRSTPSFRGEVKPEAPCRKILLYVKNTCKYEQKYFCRIARDLWCTNQKFSSVDIIPSWFFMFIYHLRDEQ